MNKKNGRKWVLHPSYFLQDFMRVTGTTLFHLLFWPRVYYMQGADKSVMRGKGGKLIICNHRSWLDAPMVELTFLRRRMQLLTAAEVGGGMNIIHKLKRWAGCLPVVRGELDLNCYRQCTQSLKEGGVLVILPEGEISFGEGMLSFKSGVTLLGVNTDTPVIPVVHGGLYRPFHRVKVAVGAPIRLKDHLSGPRATAAQIQELTGLLEERMAALQRELEEMLTAKEKRWSREQIARRKEAMDKNRAERMEKQARNRVKIYGDNHRQQ